MLGEATGLASDGAEPGIFVEVAHGEFRGLSHWYE